MKMKPKTPPTPMPTFAPVARVEIEVEGEGCEKTETNEGCEGKEVNEN